jgi:phosphoenolpyruvate synthase/pyruvate phosphate dikinase
LLIKIKECWALSFSPELILEREKNGINPGRLKIAIVITKYMHANVRGKLFSIDPVKNNRDFVIIEATDSRSTENQEKEMQDKYIVQKGTFAILSKDLNISGQPESRGLLGDDEIITLARISARLQEHNYFPQETEWIKSGGQLFILNTAPITHFPQAESLLNSSKSLPELENVGVAHTRFKVKTATKIYINLTDTKYIKEMALLNSEGLLLSGNLLLKKIGMHPKAVIKKKSQDDFVERIAAELEQVAKEFFPKPVFYKSCDFTSNDYKKLKDGKSWEPDEENPMLGFRGAFRYINSPEVFSLELLALKKVRQKYKNVSLVIPFCRTPEEFATVRRLTASAGLFESLSFKFLLLCQLPANVIQITDFVNVGLDGVIIDTDTLHNFINATDPENSHTIQESFYSPAILWAIKRILKKCAEMHISSSIYGDLITTHTKVLEDAVKLGVTSVTINAESLDFARQVIKKAEENV